MGQYHIPVNLDKREYVQPSDLGDMLKIGDQLWEGVGGTQTAVFALLAISSGRGGGDWYDGRDYQGNGVYETDEKAAKIHDFVVGRWGGERVAWVGDYANDDDLPAEDKASLIYTMCKPREEILRIIKTYRDDDQPGDAEKADAIEAELKERGPYKNIGPKVRAFLKSQGVAKYKRSTWKHRDQYGNVTAHHSYDREEL